MHKFQKFEDGSVKFMCPNCNTWALVSLEQFRGEAEMACPHPACDWHGTVNLAAEEAAARARDAAAKPQADHF